MKLSVSIAEEDVVFIDRYAHEHGMAGRSSVVQQALAKLRLNELANQYGEAWTEWAVGDEQHWSEASGDGLVKATSITAGAKRVRSRP